MSKHLTQADYQRAADSLGVPLATIKAITEVESRGSGFLPDGHPVILFERHIMFRRVRDSQGAAKAAEFAGRYPALINPSPGDYGKAHEQPGRLERAARLIDRDCALESTSWGLFQIMGFHWQALGYKRLQEFINAMYRDEAGQLDAFVRFIRINPALHQALKAKDWTGVARGYNGPNFAINRYDHKLAESFARHSTA